jgi:hypothetical protein
MVSIAPYTPVIDPKNPELIIQTQKNKKLKEVLKEKQPSLRKVLESAYHYDKNLDQKNR